MKIYALLSAALLLTLQSSAQKNKHPELPSFGKVEKTDLEMKTCDFDEKAEAVVLVDNGELTYIWGAGIEMKRRVRIKILSDKGLEQANIHLNYLSEKGQQDITGLDAQTYNEDESGNLTITRLDKKLVYDKKVDKRWSEKVFTLPNVKVGSIIEYKFKQTGMGLIDWYFQRAIPVRYSRFAMDFPNEIGVSTTPFCSHNFDRDENATGTRLEKTYWMTNVPAFRDEPYIINEDYYRDRLETKVTSLEENGLRKSQIANWIQVIRYLMEDEDFGLQIKKNIPRTADLDAELAKVGNPYDRMKTVFHYVQKNMQWNDLNGIWALDGVKSAWKDKKGTAGEINLILVNLLKDADLVVHPILVSTHENGIVSSSDAGTFSSPGFYQFNKVMAYVEIDGHVYVLDATDKNTPTHLIPADVLLTEGLVIEKLETYEWGWKTLMNNKNIARNVVMVNGAISAEGKMTGEASVTSFDYARLGKIDLCRKSKEKVIENYAKAYPGINIDEIKFENLESDSLPLVQTISYNQNLNSSGDYQYFSVNMFSGLDNNPFIADERFSDVFFGVNQSYTILGSFMLPEGFELDAMPRNRKMMMPDTSIVVSRAAQMTGNLLQTRIQLDFKRAVFPSSQYPDLQEFYKMMYDMLNEQIVVRKKAKA